MNIDPRPLSCNIPHNICQNDRQLQTYKQKWINNFLTGEKNKSLKA